MASLLCACSFVTSADLQIQVNKRSTAWVAFAFYICAIGFVVALGHEQVVRRSDNERNIYIVETNRKYLWRQTWVININWFLCNIGLYILSRNMQPIGDTFWDGAL